MSNVSKLTPVAEWDEWRERDRAYAKTLSDERQKAKRPRDTFGKPAKDRNCPICGKNEPWTWERPRYCSWTCQHRADDARRKVVQEMVLARRYREYQEILPDLHPGESMEEPSVRTRLARPGYSKAVLLEIYRRAVEFEALPAHEQARIMAAWVEKYGEETK